MSRANPIPYQSAHTLNIQDLTCQQIQADDSAWIGVAQKIRDDWTRCLNEIQVFEDLLEKDEIRRFKYARWSRFFGFLMTGFVNSVAFVAAGLPYANFDIPSYVSTIFSTITFVSSVALWTRLGESSQKYLSEGEDSKRLKLMCRNIRKNLKNIVKDGKITSQERNLIRDMMGQMHRRSEEVGSMNLFMNILGANSDKKSQVKIFGSDKKYQEAYEGVADIIQELGRSQQEIKARAPHIIKEYEDAQIQLQMHSKADHAAVHHDDMQTMSGGTFVPGRPIGIDNV